MAGMLWGAPILAADLEVPVRPKPAAAKPAATQTAPATSGIFTPPDAACLEWTDGCRTCEKPVAGEATCSNVGIACVSQAVRCTKR